ncbi:MAG TPA: phosphatase PAP2 family protein [Bryobacteraceae bacterium]|nr:phosphatase PAP2 family protein [Bryobacteraceae bacterium]
MRPRFRPYELLILAYYAYVALVAQVRLDAPVRWYPSGILLTALLILFALRRGESHLRDWMPLAYTFVAFREMNFFTPAVRDYHLENAWIGWDRWLLNTGHLRPAIESLGPVIPSYLEICYSLVYAIALISALIVLLNHRRDHLNAFWFAYLAGTLASYALFPYFPSDPPRAVFAGADLPTVFTIFRRFNLAILGRFGIHSSVFPSAHVSSCFACAWGLFLTVPERKRWGWIVAIYSFSVAVATIYGRYHFAVDAVAGFAMSFFAWSAARLLPRRV